MNDQEKKSQQIVIEKDAFRNLITHTYRFGHLTLRETHQVMGICLGSISEDASYQVKNAIPITHGNELMVGNNQQINTVISKMKEKYNTNELSVIGLYSSHLEDKNELSEEEMNNLVYFQKEVNPKSVYIVINRNLIQDDESFGLRAYTLEGEVEGSNVNVKGVNIEIEEPKSVLVYKWIQKFVEDYQKQTPILIKEVMETEEKKEMDLQEIPQEGPKASEKLFPESIYQNIKTELNKSLERIVDQQLTTWNGELTQGLMEGKHHLLDSVIQIKENVPRGINMIKTRIGELINESLESFKSIIYRHIKELDNTDELFNEIEIIFNTTENKVAEILNEQVGKNYESIHKETKIIHDICETLETEMTTIKDRLEDVNILIDSDKEKIMNQTKKFNETLETKLKDGNEDKVNNLKEIRREITDMKENELQKLQDKLEELQKIGKKIKEL